MPRPVPVRTILAAIGLVLATLFALFLIHELTRLIAWVVIAGFLAIIVAPAVDFLERRGRLRRSMATIVVFVVGFGLLSAMTYAFVQPLVDQAQHFADNLPRYVDDAEAGRGPVGRLVKRYEIDQWVRDNQPRLQEAIQNAGAPALDVLRTIANTVVGLVTILVIAFLMILEGPGLISNALNLVEESRRERVRRVTADCSRAVTGYMAGNLVISVIAGVSTFVWLLIVGVPFAGVLALWAAFADLIPLVGATLGAVPAIAVAFLHSPLAGILTVVFFILYQQFENHVLQVTIMSRTVKLNPLAVLVSVIAGVELAGILGALLAIPVAGIVQVIVRDLYDERRGRLKEVPTVGEDEVPISVRPRKTPSKKSTAPKKAATPRRAAKKAQIA